MIERILRILRPFLLPWPLFAVTAASSAAAGSANPEPWLEVRSPHFVVVTNIEEAKARRVAAELEQIRAVLKSVLPRARVDPGRPLVILVTSDDTSLRTVLGDPEEGPARQAGLFKVTPERYFLVLRLDARDPYQVVYHEYIHVLNYLNAGSIPAWLDEGLAEFYSNTLASGGTVELGRIDPAHVALLQGEKILPLEEVFGANRQSPVYNQSRKARLFYAEAWAVVHYLMLAREEGPARIQTFLGLLRRGVDQTEAARQAFGDFKRIEERLAPHFRDSTFELLSAAQPASVERESFATRKLARPEALALRASLLIQRKRIIEARKLLDEALELDAGLSLAHQGMGLLHALAGNGERAESAFARAVEADPESFLAHYYLASERAKKAKTADEREVVEAGLRRTIELNSSFAPAYDALAVFLKQGRETEEGLSLARQAVDLEPGVSAYARHLSEILSSLGRSEDAVAAGPGALAPSVAEAREGLPESRTPESLTIEPKVDENTPFGWGSERLESARGTIRNVACAPPSELTLSVERERSVLKLRAAVRDRVQFSFTGTTPLAFDPCSDIEGMTARLIYAPVSGRGWTGEILSMDLDHSRKR